VRFAPARQFEREGGEPVRATRRAITERIMSDIRALLA
jgi:hypothetical protein